MPKVEAMTFEDILPNVDRDWLSSALQDLEEVSLNCLARTVPESSVVAYSAGIDSGILAELQRRMKGEATLLTIGRSESSDARAARDDRLANSLDYRRVTEDISPQDIQNAALHVSRLVTVSSLSHFEDCVSFWLTAGAASKIEGAKYILSANGPDELYCGYDRFRRIVDEFGYQAVESEIMKSLESAYKLKRQVATVVSEFGFETREPFLEEDFKEFALKIPAEYKVLKGNDLLRKRIWRAFGRSLGIPEVTVVRQKKAMQYGMGIHPIVLSMLKKDRIKIISEQN